VIDFWWIFIHCPTIQFSQTEACQFFGVTLDNDTIPTPRSYDYSDLEKLKERFFNITGTGGYYTRKQNWLASLTLKPAILISMLVAAIAAKENFNE
jgi:hypothetical protein